jgi:hypothetical protein
VPRASMTVWMRTVAHMEPAAFYDDLAADYHLIFADWEASIARQAEALAPLLGAAETVWPTCARSTWAASTPWSAWTTRCRTC